MAIFNWIGFLFMAAAVAVLPFSIWLSRSWGWVALALGAIGGILILFGKRTRHVDNDSTTPNADLPPGQLGGELRGFAGAKILRGASDADQADT